MKTALHFIGACSLLTGTAQAQLIHGTSDYTTGQAFRYSPAAWPATPLSLIDPVTGAQIAACGMAADDANEILYISNCGGSAATPDVQLYSWKYNAPTVTVLNPSGQPIIDSVTGQSVRCEALAFGDPFGTGPALFAVHQFGVVNEGIYQLDLSMAPIVVTATQVYVFQNQALSGLDYDDTTGLFYGSNDFSAQIMAFDVVAGTQTPVDFYPPGISDVDGVAVDPGNTVYLLEDDDAGPSIHLYDLSTSSYHPSRQGAVTGSWIFSAGAWAPSFDPGGMGPIGTNYCGPAIPNSTAIPGVISAVGSNLVTLNNVFVTAEQVPSGEFGFFLVSRSQSLFMPPNSNGFVCLGGDIGRFRAPGQVGVGPTFSLQTDLKNLPTNAPGSQQTLPGDTLNFQAWYRDVGNTNNFTDAVSVTFN